MAQRAQRATSREEPPVRPTVAKGRLEERWLRRALAAVREGCAARGLASDDLCAALVLQVEGRRVQTKTDVGEAELTAAEREALAEVRARLVAEPATHRAIRAFWERPEATQRRLYYFMVSYCLTDRPVCYHLDVEARCIVGAINRRDDPEADAARAAGRRVRWVNLHQEYRRFKARTAVPAASPYHRTNSVPVPELGGEVINVGRDRFMLFLHDVAALEAYQRLEPDVLEAKRRRDRESRKRRRERTPGERRKRRTPAAPDSYRAHVVVATGTGPFLDFGFGPPSAQKP